MIVGPRVMTSRLPAAIAVIIACACSRVGFEPSWADLPGDGSRQCASNQECPDGFYCTGEGQCRALPEGDVRVWDTRKRFIKTFYTLQESAWDDRPASYGGSSAAPWVPVTSEGDYVGGGDVIVENGRLLLFFSSHGGAHCYSWIGSRGSDGRPGFASAFYVTSTNWDWQNNWLSLRILRNTPEEVLVEFRADWHLSYPERLPVTTLYRVRAGVSWLEVVPIERADRIAVISAPNRFAVAPPNSGSGTDFVVDPPTLSEGQNIDYPVPETHNQIVLQEIFWTFDDYSMNVLTCPDSTACGPTINANYEPGSPRLETIGASFAGNPVFFGFLGQRYTFVHEKGLLGGDSRGFLNIPIAANGTYRSVFAPGHAAYDAHFIPGRWRMTGRVSGEYFSRDVYDGDFVFVSPIDGVLEALIIYLYDRTQETPAGVSTPMDIYQETSGRF